MTCECGSDRILQISAKHDDRCSFQVPHLDVVVDENMLYVGPFGGDYTNLEICMDCGRVQDWEAITDEDIKAAMGDDTED